jgi:hypothetical protein
MAKELDDFLGEDTGQAEADPPSAAEPTQEGSPAAEPGESTQPAPPVEPKETDTDHPVPDDVAGLRSAIQAERAKRNDHKGRADRLEGEMAAIRAELEAARKAPPAVPVAPVVQPQTQPVAIPNMIEDPQGYHDYLVRQFEIKRFSDRLDNSEDRLRAQIGDDADVTAKIARFKELAAADPALAEKLKKDRHPYKFAYDYVTEEAERAEIGDVKAFRAKVAAEERAKLEAEFAGTQQPAAATRIQLPQSLGTARSAGPRSTPVINIAESFDDILSVRK